MCLDIIVILYLIRLSIFDKYNEEDMMFFIFYVRMLRLWDICKIIDKIYRKKDIKNVFLINIVVLRVLVFIVRFGIVWMCNFVLLLFVVKLGFVGNFFRLEIFGFNCKCIF